VETRCRRKSGVVLMRPMELYDILYEHFGPRNWWPGDSPFEIAVGAILTQQTAWTNVEMAIANLKDADMLGPVKIADSDVVYIQELIRPTGFFRQKTAYLVNFCRHLMEEHHGSIEDMLDTNLESARKELLELRGIGPETADSILLYAGGHPTFVVDAYTIRICRRTGMFDSTRYDEVKEFFENSLEPNARLYNEFHAQFVELGKQYCTARKPTCQECPVRSGCRYSRKAGTSDSPPQN